MPDLVYPASELDEANKLLALVGGFWSEVYHDGDFVAGLLYARAQVDAQAQLDFAELLAAASRFTVPLFHTDNWYFLSLRESDRNAADANFAKFDGTYTFASGLVFDEPVGTAYHVWEIPADLTDVRVVLNAVTGATLVWTQGVDFFLRDGAIWFRQNPFADDRLPKESEFEDGAEVDRTCGLWLYRGQWDWDLVYRQFGYAVTDQLRSGRGYRDFVNAIYDGLVEGTTARCVATLFAALADVPLARGTETVETITTDRRGLVVVTDQNAYRFHADSTPVVAVGDTVAAGDPLVDTVRFFEFGRGQVPATGELRALTVGRGFLAEGYFQELVFENKTVSLVVETAVDGYTKVSFDVGGFPGDVEKFWDDVHIAGVAKGETLAMLLDRRTNKVGQPTALALPAEVNPLAFLCQNVLRNNAYAVVLRPARFGPNALGLGHAKALRKLVPPHTACIVVVELAAGPDAVTMEETGTATAAGYSMAPTMFLGMAATETIDPNTYVTSRPRLTQIAGRCE